MASMTNLAILKARYYVQVAGWRLASAIVMPLLIILIVFWVLYPKAAHIKQLRYDVSTMNAAMQQHKEAWIDLSPAASLRTFYDFLPDAGQALPLLTKILATAHELGLDPSRAEYAMTPVRQAGFVRYQVTMPLTGSYIAIRTFINSLLNNIPAAAINEISFKRQDGQTEMVEARLRFTIYMRKGPA
jgi:hypothetical protein